MGGFSSFALSFSVISILTGATQLYGYGLQHGGPIEFSLGWLLVSVFTLAIALSMAELASSYPTAGALYHWSSFLGGRGLGWFTACFNTIGQFAILAGIDYGLTQFIVSLMGGFSSVGAISPSPVNIMGGLNGSALVTLIYVSILLSHALLNHYGIKLVAWLNDFSAAYHIIVVFIILGILTLKGFTQPLNFLFKFKLSDGYKPAYSFLIGLLVTQWTLTGYDASAHVTEETHDPRRNAPWGIFLAVLISMIMGFIMLAAITLSIKDLDQAVGFGDDAFVKIMTLRLGVKQGAAVVGLIAGAMWLCGLASMTSASRMVYAFARDGGLPFSKIWAKVNFRHKTPSNAIWGLTLLSLALVLSVRFYSAVVSIATIALYVSYGLPIVARLKYRFTKGSDTIGPWNLGKLSNLISIIAIAWICFIIVLFTLPPNEQAGKILGGILIFFFLMWHFEARKNFPGPKFHLK